MIEEHKDAPSHTVQVDDATFPLPSHLQNRVLSHISALRTLARGKFSNGNQRVSQLQGSLQQCVKGVFEVIEKLIGVMVALEAPLVLRLQWLQKQLLNLTKRGARMQLDVNKKKALFDRYTTQIAIVKEASSSYLRFLKMAKMRADDPKVREYVGRQGLCLEIWVLLYSIVVVFLYY